MSRYDKLIEKIKNNPKNVRFQDLDKILKNNGYIPKNNGSSHYVYTSEGKEAITIPRKQPINQVYVKEVLSLLGF